MELPKGIIFDMQDTLVLGSVRRPELIAKRVGVEEDFAVLHQQGIALGVVTTGTETNARLLLDEIGIAQYVEPYHVIGSDSVREVPVVIEAIERMPGLRGKLGKTMPVERVELRVKTVERKPSPEAVRFLMNEWGLAQPDMLFVGDAYESDGICARLAGVEFRQIPRINDDTVGILDFLEAA